MDSTEENKELNYELKSEYKRNRSSVKRLCLCLMPVLIYTWLMGLLTLLSKNAFTQIFTDGDEDYEFKGSIYGPTHNIYINYTNHTNTQANTNFDLNERKFEVYCYSNQSYDDCFDNCKGKCEFFKDWYNAGAIFLIGVIPSLACSVFTFCMMALAYYTAKAWCITIILFAFTVPPILYIITFTIWAIKMDLHENDAYHHIFKSQTAPVKRGTGLNVVIIFIVTMPFYLAFFYYIARKIKVLFNKGIRLNKSIVASSQIFTLQNDYVINNEEKKQNLDSFNSPETATQHLLEDYASPERINKSISTSFNDSLGK